MEAICIGKGIVIGINLIFGLFGCEARGSCVYNQTVLLFGTLYVNWWDDGSLGVYTFAYN